MHITTSYVRNIYFPTEIEITVRFYVKIFKSLEVERKRKKC